jgi:cation diffusion facilitator family transporter
VAARPPDEEHFYGHSKAEYFSSGAEGTLILLAALSICIAAIERLVNPQPLEQTGAGLAVSALASLINFGVARVLLRAGRMNRSIALEADARHLMTDVWTSIGVIGGVLAVSVTGWQPLDPLVALAVAANIVWSGVQLVRRSVSGLMDSALPPEESAAVSAVLEKYRARGIQFHALRTRQAAARRFVSLHALVPGSWTVRRGHQVMEQLEADIRDALPGVAVFTHMEPIEDPVSLQDAELNR